MDQPRAQPWKAFCDPESQEFRDLAASLPSQSSKGIVDAALKNYVEENEKDEEGPRTGAVHMLLIPFCLRSLN
jgi:hypothetical protein